MISIVASLILGQSSPSLSDIYAKIAKFPGVTITAEVISPSVVPITWRIAPGGKLAATYPTTVQYNTPEKWITWMPDRREYTVSKAEPGCPLPAGFEPLWPNAALPEQTGPPVETQFEKRNCFSFPLKFSGQAVDLFVDKSTLLPYGTRAKANGKVYEIVYRQIKIGAIPSQDMNFVPPPDARVAKPGPPEVNLLKAGTKLESFSAQDNFGKKHTLTSLLKDKKGLVLNFWFSSCTGCVAEMPYLVKLHPQLAKDGIGLIGVNAIDEPSIVTRSAKKSSLPYITLVGDGSKALTKTTGVLGYPVTMVVDRDQKVVDAFMGFDADRLTKAVNQLKH